MTAASWGLDVRGLGRSADAPNGLAQAFLIGEEFIDGDRLRARARRQHLLRPWHPRADSLESAAARERRRHRVWLLRQPTPTAYGVAEFDAERAWSSASKRSPKKPKLATTRSPGLYFYDQQRRRLSPRALEAIGARRARDHRPQSSSIWSARPASHFRSCSGGAWPGWTPERPKSLAPGGQLRADDSRATGACKRRPAPKRFRFARAGSDAGTARAARKRRCAKTEYGRVSPRSWFAATVRTCDAAQQRSVEVKFSELEVPGFDASSSPRCTAMSEGIFMETYSAAHRYADAAASDATFVQDNHLALGPRAGMLAWHARFSTQHGPRGSWCSVARRRGLRRRGGRAGRARPDLRHGT